MKIGFKERRATTSDFTTSITWSGNNNCVALTNGGNYKINYWCPRTLADSLDCEVCAVGGFWIGIAAAVDRLDLDQP